MLPHDPKSYKKATVGRILTAVLAVVTAVTIVMMIVVNSQASESGQLDQYNYLPIVYKPLPPTPTPPAPAFATNISLPNALCPNDIAVNEFSGVIYVVNSESNDVSMIKQDTFLGNVAIGRYPTDIAPLPNSNLTYITHLTDIPGTNQIAIFDQTTLVNRVPDYFEPHDIIYNPVNGYFYVTDLDSTVRVINGTTVLADVHLPQAGWVRSIEVDPSTGLVYATSWERGLVYVINGTTLVTQFQAGWGTLEISLEPISGYFYLAHSDPNATYPQNISVFHRNDYTVTPIYTAVRSRDVATDPVHGLAYATNPDNNSVTILSGRSVVSTIVVGQKPMPVTVNPLTGYAYVGNHDSNNVTILNNGVVVNTQPAGRQPFAIAVNTQTDEVYVANRTWRIVCDGLGRCNPKCDEFTATVTVLR